MKVIIQKFGGSSLKDDVGRRKATNHIISAIQEKYRVIVVVSAMGREGDPYSTDSLLRLISSHADSTFPKRETDLLMSCGEIISAVVMSHMLYQAGVKSTVLSGVKAGIFTNNDYGNAKITEIKTERIYSSFEDYDVVVIPGFQGVADHQEITTLGRGGSDTTASALGVALQADYIDIFTDVEGIMTADPKIVDEARALEAVTYNEVCNLAYQGAKVIHPRAVEIAMQAKVPIRIRSTFSQSEGTIVSDDLNNENRQHRKIFDRTITGITHVNDVSQIKVTVKEGLQDLHDRIFKAMAEHDISVDFINISPSGVTYTVPDELTQKAVITIQNLGFEPEIVRNCAKVSAVGAGMTGVPGVTAQIVTALANEGIQILQSADSHTTIWVLIKQTNLEAALKALHKAFHLERE